MMITHKTELRAIITLSFLFFCNIGLGQYDEFPREYGGFSILPESSKKEIIDLIFGEEGLKPAMVKMFLDPLHQKEENGPFDHNTSTQYMLEFFDRRYDKTNLQGSKIALDITGSKYNEYHVIRSIDGEETYRDIGIYEMKNGVIEYKVPPRSATSFYGNK